MLPHSEQNKTEHCPDNLDCESNATIPNLHPVSRLQANVKKRLKSQLLGEWTELNRREHHHITNQHKLYVLPQKIGEEETTTKGKNCWLEWLVLRYILLHWEITAAFLLFSSFRWSYEHRRGCDSFIILFPVIKVLQHKMVGLSLLYMLERRRLLIAMVGGICTSVGCHFISNVDWRLHCFGNASDFWVLFSM